MSSHPRQTEDGRTHLTVAAGRHKPHGNRRAPAKTHPEPSQTGGEAGATSSQRKQLHEQPTEVDTCKLLPKHRQMLNSKRRQCSSYIAPHTEPLGSPRRTHMNNNEANGTYLLHETGT
ncbi:Hypothetical predicted protein [Pelobates cultripes]|uniref:Uncharacterized protein n=1 Tax=Pelobates cultripes TaxID=61616 RepID=A0AAD1S5Q9_PELCU|nr:Hypothetical predicted protein [Pelobates cultripes]